ncbi:MAG: isoprenylcysteine carboxylmethyltransferase family protein [Anaerolineales bacterium]|jgi:protein-S-isoprenylcysteine O-methyltransferase Ste14
MEQLNLSLTPFTIPAAALLYGFIHSLIAANGFKHLIYRLLGEGAKKYYRLFYSLFASVTLLPVLILPAVIPDQTLYKIPEPLVYFTVFIQIVSVLLLVYSVLQTGALQFIGLSQAFGLKREDKLNTGGLYRYMRHPLYTFSLLVLWLTPTMTRNFALLYAALTVYIIIGAVFEERKLLQTFGAAYQEYRAKTPFLIPLKF